MNKTFNIEFEKYIKDNEFEKLPEYKGIYLFRVTIEEKNTWTSKIVYIGRADGEKGFKQRICDSHSHIDDARKEVQNEISKGNNAFLTIVYSENSKEVTDNIERIESALIFGRLPKFNTEQTKSFNYDDTTINVSGGRKFDLKDKYIIKKRND